MAAEQVRSYPDTDALAQAVATGVLDLLSVAQSDGRVASLVLTGGSVARSVHAALAASPYDLDWGRVDFWWGDERFVAADDPERNAGQARDDLLVRVPVDPRRVHEVAPAGEEYADVGAAASAYAHDLRRGMEARGPGEPWFDVLMLGIGPDGHCASLFPGRPEVASSAPVLAVRDAPKPPPTRVTMGLQTLRRADHVVFVATGSEKADAVARSVAGGDVRATPAAGPRGILSTTWFVDGAAEARLPDPADA